MGTSKIVLYNIFIFIIFREWHITLSMKLTQILNRNKLLLLLTTKADDNVISVLSKTKNHSLFSCFSVHPVYIRMFKTSSVNRGLKMWLSRALQSSLSKAATMENAPPQKKKYKNGCNKGPYRIWMCQRKKQKSLACWKTLKNHHNY